MMMEYRDVRTKPVVSKGEFISSYQGFSRNGLEIPAEFDINKHQKITEDCSKSVPVILLVKIEPIIRFICPENVGYRPASEPRGYRQKMGAFLILHVKE